MIAIASVDQASDKSFDYIVIGGGTAGLALACRLTEDASKTVLVLEAGDTHFGDSITEMLAGFGKAFGNPKYDWAFNTAPQEHADGTVFTWNRGKGLGGSSFMNFYIWTMPSKEELDAWEALGNPGWNWDNIARYSNKAEVFVPPSDESEKTEELTYDLKYHGTDGPIATGFYTTRSGFDITLRDALATFGLKHNTEPVSGDHLGTNFVLASIDPRIQKRSDSRAYLKLAASRPNLTVLPNAPATQILSSSSSSSEFVASGVKFLFDGVEHSASAAKEVILSAGAIKSPQLLELSGIGNASALTKLGIETKVDLPAVGENVQEHIFAGMSWEFKEPGKYNTFDTLADPQVLTSELEKLKNGGDGLLTMGVSSLHFAPLKLVASAAADKVQGVRAAPGSRPGLAEQFTTQVKLAEKGVPDVELLTFPGFLSSPNRPEEGKKYFSLSPALNRMFSRGSVHAGSKDALSNPIVDPRYLEEEVDLEALLGFVKWTRELVHSETLKPHFGKEINPGPDVQTDEELKAWIKKNLASTFHGAGSCAMMPRDKGGVVDSSLKVYGTRNLRVVDMSIIPLHVNCHTQALVYGIAERAADIIKGVV